MKQKLQEIVKTSLPSPVFASLLLALFFAVFYSFTLFGIIERVRLTLPLARSPFYVLRRIEKPHAIKFACLYCERAPETQEPGPQSALLPSPFCGFYISIEPCFPPVCIPFICVLFDFKVFAILWVFFERDSVIHIYFISLPK